MYWFDAFQRTHLRYLLCSWILVKYWSFFVFTRKWEGKFSAVCYFIVAGMNEYTGSSGRTWYFQENYVPVRFIPCWGLRGNMKPWLCIGKIDFESIILRKNEKNFVFLLCHGLWCCVLFQILLLSMPILSANCITNWFYKNKLLIVIKKR